MKIFKRQKQKCLIRWKSMQPVVNQKKIIQWPQWHLGPCGGNKKRSECVHMIIFMHKKSRHEISCTKMRILLKSFNVWKFHVCMKLCTDQFPMLKIIQGHNFLFHEEMPFCKYGNFKFFCTKIKLSCHNPSCMKLFIHIKAKFEDL